MQSSYKIGVRLLSGLLLAYLWCDVGLAIKETETRRESEYSNYRKAPVVEEYEGVYRVRRLNGAEEYPREHSDHKLKSYPTYYGGDEHSVKISDVDHHRKSHDRDVEYHGRHHPEHHRDDDYVSHHHREDHRDYHDSDHHESGRYDHELGRDKHGAATAEKVHALGAKAALRRISGELKHGLKLDSDKPERKLHKTLKMVKEVGKDAIKHGVEQGLRYGKKGLEHRLDNYLDRREHGSEVDAIKHGVEKGLHIGKEELEHHLGKHADHDGHNLKHAVERGLKLGEHELEHQVDKHKGHHELGAIKHGVEIGLRLGEKELEHQLDKHRHHDEHGSKLGAIKHGVERGLKLGKEELEHQVDKHLDRHEYGSEYSHHHDHDSRVHSGHTHEGRPLKSFHTGPWTELKEKAGIKKEPSSLTKIPIAGRLFYNDDQKRLRREMKMTEREAKEAARKLKKTAPSVKIDGREVLIPEPGMYEDNIRVLDEKNNKKMYKKLIASDPTV